MKCNAVASNPLTSQLPFGGDVGKHAMLVRTGGGRWRATRLPPAEVNHARPPKQNQNKTKTKPKQNKTKQNKTKQKGIKKLMTVEMHRIIFTLEMIRP